MKPARQPILGRDILLKIGQGLRSHYETRVAERNPHLDMLALRADAALRGETKDQRHEMR